MGHIWVEDDTVTATWVTADGTTSRVSRPHRRRKPSSISDGVRGSVTTRRGSRAPSGPDGPSVFVSDPGSRGTRPDEDPVGTDLTVGIPPA